MNNTPKQFARFISPTPKCEIVTLTQPLVDWLLSINTSNRKVKTTVVRRYAEEIRRGEWEVTSQGIGVSNDGVTLDGQHRLLALRECGYPPTQSVLVWGLRKEAQLKVDTHTKRSISDLMSLAVNVTINERLASALRIVNLAVAGSQNFTEVVSISDLVETYEDVRDIVSGAGFPTAANGVTGGFIAACIYAAQNGAPIDSIRAFVNGFTKLENLCGGNPILRLKASYDEDGIKAGSKGQTEWFCKVARAVHCFVNGEKIKKLYPCATPADAVKLLRSIGKVRAYA